jgi:argininosuccinate lyase
MRNSLDAVSDRDFVIETVFACAMIALHLSGWAEEWIVWSTSEFGFLQLPDRLCTGSSIMPQKINPDLLELVRGKAARVTGSLQTLLMLIKGLPLAYNRDLQEDKPPLMDAVATTEACLEVAAAAVEGARLVPDAIAGSLATGYLDATTLMEHLIGRGIPQRRAHQLVGPLVRKAAANGTPLGELPLEEFRKIDSTLDESVYDVLGPHRSVAAYRTDGSSAPELVDRQVRWWQARLEASAPPESA